VAPAAIDSGVVNPDTENPLPVVVTFEIVNGADPVFVSWMICVLCVPTATF
jgi:hypothetical protein